MKRAYKIRVERGCNWSVRELLVVATEDTAAIRKAKKLAVQQSGGVLSSWRCTNLRELETAVVL